MEQLSICFSLWRVRTLLLSWRSAKWGEKLCKETKTTKWGSDKLLCAVSRGNTKNWISSYEHCLHLLISDALWFKKWNWQGHKTVSISEPRETIFFVLAIRCKNLFSTMWRLGALMTTLKGFLEACLSNDLTFVVFIDVVDEQQNKLWKFTATSNSKTLMDLLWYGFAWS